MSTLTDRLRARWFAEHRDRIPTDGLVFYAPLDAKLEYAETGEQLIYGSAVTASDFSVDDGIPCYNYVGSVTSSGVTPQKIIMTNAYPWHENMTLSSWLKNLSTTNKGISPGFCGDVASSSLYRFRVQFESSAGLAYFEYQGGSSSKAILEEPYSWHNVTYTLGEKKRVALWLDGTKMFEDNYEHYENIAIHSSVLSGFSISGMTGWDAIDYNYKSASCRVYDRVLTDSEIKSLANEFHPTT